jgi:hypothetical protein
MAEDDDLDEEREEREEEPEPPRDTAVPSNDAYTGMLAISLIALIIGSVLLFLDYSQYSGKAPSVPQLSAVPSPQKKEAAPIQQPPVENKGEEKKQ